MLDALIILGICALAALLVVALIAARRPDTFSFARSQTIAAPPEAIFPLIDDLRAFNRWNPFLKKDPNTVLTYSGPERGAGAAHEWDGNSNVGKGRVEITESEAPRKVVMRLDMLKPMVAHNRVEFSLVPVGAATTVTWSMQGKQPFLAKLMTVFIDCDKMVGGEFSKGLADLKAIAER